MIRAVRVNDIILDENHPKWRSAEDIGAIRYTEIQEQTTETSNSNTWAKPYHFNISHFPLINEIVELIAAPKYNYNEDSSPDDYYISTRVLSVDGNVNNNELPDFIPESGTPVPLGNYFQRNDLLRRLKPYEGDLIIQGRSGNSIRFGSTIENAFIKNPLLRNRWSNEGNIGDPITIITNGIEEKTLNDNKQIENVTIEDINKDNSSIWLCSNQQISNFEVASIHNDSYYYDSEKQKIEEPVMDDTFYDLVPEVEEEPVLAPAPELPPEELQETDELEELEEIDMSAAYYDIAPSEKQKISIGQPITLPESYLIPDTVDINYLNEDVGSGFKKIHNIESRAARENQLNNYPPISHEDPSYNDENIWYNLNQLHTNCIKPIIDTFGADHIKITSAYRTEEVNNFIGGVPNSQHLKGYAVDLVSTNHASYKIFNWVIRYLPEWNQLIWEYPERGMFYGFDEYQEYGLSVDFSWIHISYIEGNNPKIRSMSSQREDIHDVWGEKRNELAIRQGDYSHNIAPNGLSSMAMAKLNLDI